MIKYMMQVLLYQEGRCLILCLILFLMIGEGCKSSEKDRVAQQEQLQVLLAEQEQLQASISRLKKELHVNTFQNDYGRDTLILRPRLFRHYIKLQAMVEGSENLVVVPKGAPGVVEQIFVHKGERVKKGQVLLRMNDTMVVAQMNNLQTRLNLAKDLLARQEKLWVQKIGSEIELEQRRNDVSFLETQMATLRTSQSFTVVRAPIEGIIDALELQVGELFMGYAGGNVPQLRIVNFSALKARIWVPDIYVGRVRKGSPLQLNFLDSTLILQTKVSDISQYINPTTRSFLMEAPLPPRPQLRLNMIGTACVLDYENPRAFVIPIDILQTDIHEPFVYTCSYVETEKGYVVVKKKVRIGQVQGAEVEIVSGLVAGDILLLRNVEQLEEGMQLDL